MQVIHGLVCAILRVAQSDDAAVCTHVSVLGNDRVCMLLQTLLATIAVV